MPQMTEMIASHPHCWLLSNTFPIPSAHKHNLADLSNIFQFSLSSQLDVDKQSLFSIGLRYSSTWPQPPQMTSHGWHTPKPHRNLTKVFPNAIQCINVSHVTLRINLVFTRSTKQNEVTEVRYGAGVVEGVLG